MTDELQELIAQGPDPNRGLTALVLLRYHEIQLARQYARPWAKIAAALRLTEGKEKALSAAFWRVSRGIEAGRLKAPPQATTRTTATNQAPAPAAGRFKKIEIDPPINQ